MPTYKVTVEYEIEAENFAQLEALTTEIPPLDLITRGRRHHTRIPTDPLDPGTVCYVEAARMKHENDELQIDSEPDLSIAEDGAWVAAWVWVGDQAAGLCSQCRQPCADAAEFDGLCASCIAVAQQ